jgi:hypothetical protein
MPTSATAAYPTALFPQGRLLRPRFTLRAENGFLAACPGLRGSAITTVDDVYDAVHFVDFDAACHRAHLMTEVGWTNLRIVEILVPSFL